MALTVVWTPDASQSLEEIAQYLHSDFGAQAAAAYLGHVTVILGQLCEYPRMYPEVDDSGVRRAVVARHTSLYYRIEGDALRILLFWNNRKSPQFTFWG